MTFTPSIIKKQGFGTFSNENIEFTASFTITHFPQNTIIETQINKNIDPFKLLKDIEGMWKLEGSTKEDESVVANDFLFTNLNGSDISFLSYKNLTFSKKNNGTVNKIEFPLFGYYGNDFSFEYKNFKIACFGDNAEAKKMDSMSNNWNQQFEGKSLFIESDYYEEEQFLTTARHIIDLLSLAVGNDVGYSRSKYYSKETLLFEKWRRMVDYHFGAAMCIPDFEVGHYIEDSLPTYEDFNIKKRKLYFATITSLNSSSKGFIEDRLLRVCISWESFASYNKFKRKSKMSNELKNLNMGFINLIHEFDLPKDIDKVALVSRVSRAIEQPILRERLINILEYYQLDSYKLNIDVGTILKIRNSLAHNYFLSRDEYPKDLYLILNDLVFGLQVILLIELKYTGLVLGRVDNWSKIYKIQDLIRNPTRNIS